MDLVLNKIENLYQEMTIIECINCGDDCYSKLEKEELIKSGYYCENCEEIIDNIEEYEPKYNIIMNYGNIV